MVGSLVHIAHHLAIIRPCRGCVLAVVELVSEVVGQHLDELSELKKDKT